MKTKNIYLASSLIARGYTDYKLIKEGTQAEFIFNNYTDAIQDDIENYWNDELLVSGKKVFSVFKELKIRILS
jgi:hypothetical protein